MKLVRTLINGSLSRAFNWLSQSSSDCVVCAKPRDGRRPHSHWLDIFKLKLLEQSLCYDCLSTIPWLQRIYCSTCGRGINCEDCARSPRRSFLYNRSAVAYDNRMKEWLARYKYRGDEQLSAILGTMLIPAYERLTETVNPMKFNRRNGVCWDAVVYVPISKERAEERGFNQAEQLATFIAGRYALPIYHLLARSKHTEKQSFKSRAERMKGTRAIFSINILELERFLSNNERKTESLRILLVDDIYTTGSTVTECADTIRRHLNVKCELSVLTWARS